jgi:hypothetical protein
MWDPPRGTYPLRGRASTQNLAHSSGYGREVLSHSLSGEALAYQEDDDDQVILRQFR